MASDDTQVFRAQQARHSAKIAAERELMDATGLSRNQIRQGLKNSLSSFVDAFQQRRDAQRAEVKVNRQDRMIIEHPQIFSARAFAPVETGGVASGALGSSSTPGTGGDLPTASAGDMLYYDGTAWVVLANPGAPSTPGLNEKVLRHNGTAPYWETPTAGC
jgi:hypothetical protein